MVFGHGRRGHGPLSQSIPRGLEGRLSAVSLRPWHRSPPVAPGRPLVTIMGHQDPDLVSLKLVYPIKILTSELVYPIKILTLELVYPI